MSEVTPKVVLLNYTQNPEQTIAISAKLCYSDSTIDEIKEGVESKDVSKFITMIKRLGHFSPIEHASFTFGVEGVSRSFLAQVTRHRIASFSVKSQRYVSASKTEQFNYIIPPAIKDLGEDSVNEYKNQMATMQQWYNVWQEKLGGNIEKANEDARFVLPNSAETKMTITMNARELMHFFNLRCCNRAQWEIRDVAWQMLKLVVQIAPTLFENCGPQCLQGVCPEGKMCCGKAKEIRERRDSL
ncbi:MAG: FAD-dependent thymidylate synthase [Clostridia bacterium]